MGNGRAEFLDDRQGGNPSSLRIAGLFCCFDSSTKRCERFFLAVEPCERSPNVIKTQLLNRLLTACPAAQTRSRYRLCFGIATLTKEKPSRVSRQTAQQALIFRATASARARPNVVSIFETSQANIKEPEVVFHTPKALSPLPSK